MSGEEEERERGNEEPQPKEAPAECAMAWTPGGTEESQLDDVIDRLLEVRQSRPGKQVQLTEQEIRHLCLTAKEIFMSQPNLLELEAPIKICGAFQAAVWRVFSARRLSARIVAHDGPPMPQATSMGSTRTCCGCSSTGASRRRPTTCSWGTTLTEASRAWRQSASCWPIRCAPRSSGSGQTQSSERALGQGTA